MCNILVFISVVGDAFVDVPSIAVVSVLMCCQFCLWLNSKSAHVCQRLIHAQHAYIHKEVTAAAAAATITTAKNRNVYCTYVPMHCAVMWH